MLLQGGKYLLLLMLFSYVEITYIHCLAVSQVQ